LAVGDSYDAGFYTHGVDAAAYMDQGGAVLDPFYIPAQTGALLPRVSLTITHEDNVFLDSKGTNQGTYVSLVPGLLAIWGKPTGNHLYADYGLSIPTYESGQDLKDRPSHMLKLGVVYRTGKSQVQGGLGYRRLENNVDTVVGARVTKQDYIGDLSVENQISGKSSVGAQGRVEIHDFDSEDYADYNRYYGAGRLYHSVSAKSQVFIQAGIGRDDPREMKDSAMGADFYDLSLGVRGKQSPKVNTSGRLGYMWRTYDEETRAEYAHWIASLRAQSSPFGLTTFSAELNADVRPAIDSDGTDVIDQGAVLSASRRLFIERLRGNASVTVGRIDYSGRRQAGSGAEGEGDQAYDGRSDDYWGFSLGVDWWTRQRFSIGLAYSYTQRDGSRNADSATQEATSYEYERLTWRASWNY
jgi:hypothetical protein